MVLHGHLCGRVGRRQDYDPPNAKAFGGSSSLGAVITGTLRAAYAALCRGVCFICKSFSICRGALRQIVRCGENRTELAVITAPSRNFYIFLPIFHYRWYAVVHNDCFSIQYCCSSREEYKQISIE